MTRGNTDVKDPALRGTNGNGVAYYDFDNAGKRVGANTPKGMILPITPRGSMATVTRR